MGDAPDSKSTPVGLYSAKSRKGVTGIEISATILSVVWVIGAGYVFLTLGSSDGSALVTIQTLMTMLAIFLPVGMIWVGATAARSMQVMREETTRLQIAIDALRQSYIAQSKQQAQPVTGLSITRKLDEIAAAQRKTESAIAMFSTTRDIRNARIAQTVADAYPDDQGKLALGTLAEEIAAPLSNADFIRALNFPETAEDEQGFAALRRALKDRQLAQLIQASQDVLTLLSQDGIYMDDLRPDMARPETWRRFAAGERGRAVAALGGIRDRSSLALTAGRMKQDPIFRDAVHHFLRLFDKNLIAFDTRAADAEISAFSETRTARAFMLLGRVAGTFD